MSVQRAVESQSAARDRRPAAAALATAQVQNATAARAVQSRLGNRGLLALATLEGAPVIHRDAAGGGGGAAGGLRVSSPHDTAEREAVSTASAVMRMSDPGPVSSSGPAVSRAETRAGALAGSAAPAAVNAGIASAMSGGAPLAPATRAFMEPRFKADFSRVRIHTDNQAASMSQQLSAKAFTVGNHIFFGRDAYQPDRADGRELLAHELTHTIQQGGSVRREIQREEEGSWLSSVSADGLARMAISAVAPSLLPLMGGAGLTGWLETRVGEAVSSLFDSLLSPVRGLGGAGQELVAVFGPMLATLQTAAAQIAQNDCSPLREAAEKIEKTAAKLITPIVEKLQPIVTAIRDFLDSVWQKIGSPIWEWIKAYAAFQWQMVQDIASLVGRAAKWLWDKTALVRSAYVSAWRWLMDKLGVGDSPEGQDGVLQWVQRKLSAIWDVVKAKLAPFTGTLKAVGAAVGSVLLALSPAGPIMAIAGAAAGAAQGLKWLYANWGKGNIIATARLYIERTLIPPLLAAAQSLGATVTGAATAISGSLMNLAATLTAAVGAAGGSALSFLVSGIQWVANQAQALAAWANGHLAKVGTWLTTALKRLETFLTGVLQFLGRVADVVIDIWGLPILLGEEIWNKIPACIRDPIVDFLGPIILSQIEIFRELAANPEAWQKTKADVGKIIKLVFHDHDLDGAIKATFQLVLRVFNLPPELLITVMKKAEAAWDVVVKKPLDFLRNTVRSLGHGFKLLWDDKLENLKLGLQGWLLGEIKEKNITVPTDWTNPRQLFDFALSVLGLSADHVYELLKKRFQPGPIDLIRKVIGKVAGVVAWVDKAIDATKTPAENAAGMVNQAKDFGKTILTGVAEWVAGKVAEEIAIMAAAAAASAGLSEVVDIARRIYRAILTAVRWANRIVMMVNEALDNVLDIAGGQIEKVGGTFLKLMKRAMPVVIGFLADQVGLGGVGAAIRGLVDEIREKVDTAILWVIDKIKAALDALINLVKAGIKAVTDWWKERRNFTGADGKPHAIYFRGSENSAELIVESTPTPIEKYLADVFADEDIEADVKTLAKDALVLYQTKILPLVKKPADEQRKGALPENLNDLSGKMMKIVGAKYSDLPDQDAPQFTAPKISRVSKVSTRNVKKGSDASGDSPAMQRLTAAGLTTSKGRWVRMHLVTAQIGGPGGPQNWVPAPGAVNTGSAVRGFERQVEALVRNDDGRARRPNVLWVEVNTVNYHDKWSDPVGPHSYAGAEYSKDVRFRAGLFFPKKAKEWVENTAPSISTTVSIPPPSLELSGAAPNVNAVGPKQLQDAARITGYYAAEMVKQRPYKNSNDVKKALEKTDRQPAAFQEFIAALQLAETEGRIVYK